MTTLKNGLFFSKRETSLPLPLQCWTERDRKRSAVRDDVLWKGGGDSKEEGGGMCKQESFQDKVQPTRISRFKSLLINAKLKILLETASWPSPWEIKI